MRNACGNATGKRWWEQRAPLTWWVFSFVFICKAAFLSCFHRLSGRGATRLLSSAALYVMRAQSVERIAKSSNISIPYSLSDSNEELCVSALMVGEGDLVSFFLHADLGHGALNACRHSMIRLCPTGRIRELTTQGGCSYTVLVDWPNNESTMTSEIAEPASAQEPRAIILFRRSEHALSPTIAKDAKSCYGELCPSVQELPSIDVGINLRVYRMSYLPGVRFSDIQPRKRDFEEYATARLKGLMISLVDFHVTAWRSSLNERRRGCRGQIGNSLLWRLKKLESELPLHDLRARAGIIRRKVEAGDLSRLPNVLTHGDLVPSNILVDADTWKLTGVVDWAEGEYLPFGMSLYGLEHVLGYLHRTEDGAPRFQFYANADSLRATFYCLIEQQISALQDPGLMDVVALCRDVGVLLWHGIAWDDGRLDRVVQAGRDDDEIALLKAFMRTGLIARTESKL